MRFFAITFLVGRLYSETQWRGRRGGGGGVRGWSGRGARKEASLLLYV